MLLLLKINSNIYIFSHKFTGNLLSSFLAYY